MITTYASRDHYADHLAPVASRLDDVSPDVALVASYRDLCTARKKHDRIVLMQHGIGQSYSDAMPAYPGGRDNDSVGLFLVPGEQPAKRWRDAYPRAAVEVVGSPRLDDLPDRIGPPGRVVAVTFHWDNYQYPESRSAFDYFRPALRDLAERFEVIGHGHPRARPVHRFWESIGVEYVPSFDEVCRRADVLAFDNTSAGFEFAATGRPVVVMSPPWYRRDVSHGLRFWDAANVGTEATTPGSLRPAVERALANVALDRISRDAALNVVFAHRSGAAQRAADGIRGWAA